MTPTHDRVPGRLVEIPGTRLHVAEHGNPGAPPLLFVHGGPGQGAYDFVHHQGALLSAHLRLVAVDQRGSLFSDPLRDGDEVTETRTVADLEALRESLDIDRWAVLGHSFGARIALRYAVQHPGRVSAAAFENPAWDYAKAATTQVEAVLTLLQETGGDTDPAEALLAQPEPITSAQRRAVVDSLGEAQQRLWFHRPERLTGNPLVSTELPAGIANRGDAPAAQLLAHEELHDPLTTLLPDLSMPALLLLGLYDCVTDDDTIEQFNADADFGEVTWLEESGHFSHIEEPESYARAVTGLVADS
jgi:proline iminopeptidase